MANPLLHPLTQPLILIENFPYALGQVEHKESQTISSEDKLPKSGYGAECVLQPDEIWKGMNQTILLFFLSFSDFLDKSYFKLIISSNPTQFIASSWDYSKTKPRLPR